MTQLNLEEINARVEPYRRIPQDVIDAVTETVVICDAALIPRLIDLSPLDRRVRLTVEKWKPLYKAELRHRVLRGNPKKLKKEVTTIQAADAILKSLIGCLFQEEGISGQFLSHVANGELQKIANWLSWWPTRRGRPAELALAQCAEALASVFRKNTGTPSWKRVGQIIAKEFPEAGPPVSGDLRLWVVNSVRRHQTKNQELRKLPPVDQQLLLRTNSFTSQHHQKKKR